MKKIKKIYYILKYYLLLSISIFFRKKYKNTWLISERGDEARDNGYYFYKYIKENHPEIEVKYVITKNSKDLDLIKEEDRIYYRTSKHYMCFINAKYLISTHHMGYAPIHWVFSILDKKKLLFLRGKKIFLQHGITYNMVKSLVGRTIDLFITVSDLEQKFVEQNLKLKKNCVKTLGFSRYDYFEQNETNTILVMPTWRRNLSNLNENDFCKTDYYKKWNSLLNSEELNNLLKKNNLNLLFYPHYEMQKYINLFERKSENVIYAKAENYYIHNLIDECKCFITDYSSTFFDAAYTNKPIVYYQFDYEEFYNIHYKEGYFSAKTDGFGKVCETENEIIEEIKNIIKNNYKVEKKYKDRKIKFYKYNDKNNNERIYNEINKL